ncbi:GNAT family N-acetyltransferase [Caldinitratiruptor microaerophilus]|uniref:N-acetyltransferase domain-containing protein n=1 Tax=Caldinitratiruptor microaerophilus TaxID=671077 RepID=A0AA35CPD6_9FIRM|nr:GNAT family N-acetyltransferase [Caldinitratiruptor microaerophilus]BDG62424.1 hypothetical protein caldi_35140 [Caldinitratiruptor microaerophilus]
MEDNRRQQLAVQAAPVTLKEVKDPGDPDILRFRELMVGAFADPNMIADPDQLTAWVRDRDGGGRRFHLLVVRVGGQVAGGTLFSYVPETNVGFSEYIIVAPAYRGHGLARLLFQRRLTILEWDARLKGKPPIRGIFIEVAHPMRLPPELYEADRRMAVDPVERRRIMHHFGFRQLDLEYNQPPLTQDREPVSYLDLLFLPLDPDLKAAGALPAEMILRSLRPIWRAWAVPSWEEYLRRMRRALDGKPVAMLPCWTPEMERVAGA